MKYLDCFLMKDILKTFKRCRVAFLIDDIQPYDKAMASIRMRCYDVMEYFEKEGIPIELYKPFKKYDVVFFSKTCYDSAIEAAEKLQKKGTRIFFDGFCEYLTNDEIQTHEKENILKLISMSKIVGVPSAMQKEMFSKKHNDVRVIPESVHQSFFQYRKQHVEKSEITLVYCGYAAKAKDTLCIKNVISKLQKEYGCKLLYICEKDPKLEELKYKYIHYDQRKIPKLLLEGDIMIAPRPMEGISSRGHSFSKAAYPLAVGLPVVASPMPSYINSPVILCSTEDEWYSVLKELISKPNYRQSIGNEGAMYVKENYSIEKIGNEYLEIYKQLSKK